MELFNIHSKPSERRAFQRKECNIPIQGVGTIRNIGLGGVYLEANNIDKEDIVLRFKLEPERFVISNAKVVNKRSLKDKKGYGLQFVDIDASSRLHILKYLNGQTEYTDLEENIWVSLDSFVKTWPNQYSLVSPEFKKEIADFRLYLNQLKTILSREENKLSILAPAEKNKMCSPIIEFYEKELQDKVHRMMLAVNQVIKDFTETEHVLHRTYFQEQLLEFTNDSVFFNRALHKPLGYAGDYLMMELLYHGLRSGETLWHQVINSCLTSIPLGQAVRNRAWFLSECIANVLEVKPDPNIMSLACGSCEEVAIVLEKGYPAAHYYLVDQDLQALQYAKNKLTKIQFKTKSTASFSFHSDSVKDFFKKPEIVNEYPKMDLIYTAGLYDYLNNSVAVKLTSILLSLLKPSGKLIIGNFTRGDFSYFIEYASNWFLTYRTKEELLKIVPTDLAIQHTKIEKEPSGVNLFLCLQKP